METSRTLQHPDVMRPNELGRYRLIAELARGGMGIVYLALVRGPAGFNKLFVLKELKAHLAEDRDLVSMFVEEARLSAKLSHPNVVQTIEVGSEGDRHFMAMEYLEGQSYHRILDRASTTSTTVPLHIQLQILAATLDGLHHAHRLTDFDGARLGIVHRDVSPQNVFVTYDGQVKVVDFGIAKALDSSRETRAGVLKGKIAYMAPEQAAGDPIDCRADLFSVGVMLWEAVVGRRMWGSTLNDRQILHALVHGNVPPPRELLPDIPEELERIILKATAAVPDQRYASAADLQADLEAYLKSTGATLGAREMGKFVAEAFAKERAQIKSVIDTQVKAAKNTSTGEFQSVALARLAGPTSGGTPASISVVRGLTGASGLTGENPSARPPSPAQDVVGIAASGAHAALPTAKRPPTLIIALAAAVMALAAVLVFAVTRPSAPPAPAAARPTAPTTPPEPAATTPPAQTQGIAVALPPITPPVVPQKVDLAMKLKASPSQAKIWVDGVEVAANPYSAQIPKDGASHKVRADAPGYVPKEMLFTADSDVSLELALDPIVRSGVARPAPVVVAKAPEPAVHAPPAPPPAQPPPVAAPPLEHTGRPVRPIDSKNPY